MNETLFILHCAGILLFLFGALKIGKEALITYVAACWLFANFFVTKQILLFGFEVTASDVYAIGAMLGISIIQELWGRTYAVTSIWISFFLLGFACATSYLHLFYEPSLHDVMHPHFAALLQATPRLMVASFATFLISSRVEIVLFGLLQRAKQIPFPIRSGISTATVMLFDTILFSILGLYGLVASLYDVCLVSYLIKLMIVCMLAPFLTFVHYVVSSNHFAPQKI